jgi:hypothetical protein
MSFKAYLENTKPIDWLENQLEQLSRGVDVDVSQHLIDRVIERKINPKEIIETFGKFIGKYSSKLANDKKQKIGGIIQNVINELNLPLEYDNNGTPSPKDDVIHLITVMKKEGFVSNNKEDKIFKVK